MIIGLTVILLLVLLLPFTFRIVEKNLELYLFLMGMAAATVSQVMDGTLFISALRDPIFISLAVLGAGLLFRWLQTPLEKAVLNVSSTIPFRLFTALVVAVLGLIASVVTAIIAAIMLVSIVSILRLDRKSELRMVVLACFSIGLGAALTPLGEPLSTIATHKLQEDFFFLLELIGAEVVPAVILFGILAAFMVHPKKTDTNFGKPLERESYSNIIFRSLKIYLFVMGLTLLGAGFEPLIEMYVLGVNPHILYWINMISAILDNATLAAAEISPAMDHANIKAILLGLLISGGMLIPGNIPNIIAAGKLNITSSEWARIGLPTGIAAMILYFINMVMFG